MVKDEKRLVYQSWHCGLRELDLILGPFAEKNIPSMSEAERAVYESLLAQNGIDLLNWITGATKTPDEFETNIMNKIKQNVIL